MRFGGRLSACVVGLCLVVSDEARAGGNLLANGGFETGDLGGWQVSGNPQFTLVSDHAVGTPGLGPDAPHGGSNYAMLGAVGPAGVLSQTIATKAGDSYIVSWWLATDSDVRNEFAASWDGATIVDRVDVPREGYELFTETVVATGSSSTLSFSYRNDPGFFSLDDVSVVAGPSKPDGPTPAAVPEPSVLILAGMGLAAVLAAGRARISLTRAVRLR